MNKYQKLRDKIIEANPSITDLEFGCKFLYTDRTASKGYVKQVEYICSGGHFKKEKGVGYFMSNAQWRKMDKIIGRDITLEDCMITIEKSEHPFVLIEYKSWDNGKSIGCYGVNIDEEESRDILFLWQLNKPLQDQSNETKEFLFNLLK